MNIYLSDEEIYDACIKHAYNPDDLCIIEYDKAIMKASANHAVKEVLKAIRADKKFTDEMFDGDALPWAEELEVCFSREIWDELYQKVDLSSFNFSLFGNSPDLRKEIGNKLANKEIKWIKKNPTPLPWFINPLLKKNLLKMYIKKIESFLGN